VQFYKDGVSFYEVMWKLQSKFAIFTQNFLFLLKISYFYSKFPIFTQNSLFLLKIPNFLLKICHFTQKFITYSQNALFPAHQTTPTFRNNGKNLKSAKMKPTFTLDKMNLTRETVFATAQIIGRVFLKQIQDKCLFKYVF
jgi:hypothetical protein